MSTLCFVWSKVVPTISVFFPPFLYTSVCNVGFGIGDFWEGWRIFGKVRCYVFLYVFLYMFILGILFSYICMITYILHCLLSDLFQGLRYIYIYLLFSLYYLLLYHQTLCSSHLHQQFINDRFTIILIFRNAFKFLYSFNYFQFNLALKHTIFLLMLLIISLSDSVCCKVFVTIICTCNTSG